MEEQKTWFSIIGEREVIQSLGRGWRPAEAISKETLISAEHPFVAVVWSQFVPLHIGYRVIYLQKIYF